MDCWDAQSDMNESLCMFLPHPQCPPAGQYTGRLLIHPPIPTPGSTCPQVIEQLVAVFRDAPLAVRATTFASVIGALGRCMEVRRGALFSAGGWDGWSGLVQLARITTLAQTDWHAVSCLLLQTSSLLACDALLTPLPIISVPLPRCATSFTTRACGA